MPPKQVAQWTVDEVENFLLRLHLDVLAPRFKKAGVNGRELLRMPAKELSEKFGCTQAQIHKLDSGLQQISPAAMGFMDLTANQETVVSYDAPPPPSPPAELHERPTYELGKHGISKHNLIEYRGYKEKIKELQDADLDKQALIARQNFEEVSDRKAEIVKRLHEAVADLEKAKKNMSKLDGWYYERLLPARLGAGWLEARKNKRLQDLENARTALLEVKEEIVQADYDLDCARQDLNSTIREMGVISHCHSCCLVIFDRIFTARSWDKDEAMVKVKKAMFDAAAKAAAASEQANLYSTAKDLLAEANLKITQALAALDRSGVTDFIAKNSSSMPTLRNMAGIYGRTMSGISPRGSIGGISPRGSIGGISPKGSVGNTPRISPRGSGTVTPRENSVPGRLELDVAQFRVVKEANEMIKSAAADYSAAHDIVPSIPIHSDSLIISARAGLFLTVLAPGFLGNLSGAAILQRCIMTAQEMGDVVKLGLEWADRKYSTSSYDVKKLQKEAATKRADVAAYQNRLLEGALAALDD